MSKHQFLWLDLETTGLNPDECRILEWAVVLAADDADGDMSPIAQYSGVIAVDPDDALPEMNDFVRNMHTKNGLLEECYAAGKDVESETSRLEAEEFLVGLCTGLAGPEPKGIVLAGSTVAFDLSFIRVHMPRFAKCLSHRCFDVSTLKMAELSWCAQPFKKAEAHRALPDVLESLAHAAEIKARRFTP